MIKIIVEDTHKLISKIVLGRLKGIRDNSHNSKANTMINNFWSFNYIIRKFREKAEYCTNRWVAIEGVGEDGCRVFIRYGGDGRPLTIRGCSGVVDVLRRYGGLKPRTIYASVNLYSSLQSLEDINTSSRIMYTSPIWDVDGSVENWKSIN
jgi:hypothetical protein